MQSDVGIGTRQPAEKLFYILGSYDVIDGVEVEQSIALRQRFKFVDYVAGRFCPEFHAGAIQTAECAMILHSPPTASGCLDGKQHLLRLVIVLITALLAG